MFYPVTIYSPDGRVKKVISTKALEKRHWKNFFKSVESRAVLKDTRRQIPGWVKKKLDLDYPEPVFNINH
ncbi:hypothetical protein UR09_02850 [Candidatus Nitromaritima sp. SCGC AAA799-A02]|nr:hypothetical protein UZ36_06935 [Candidatus Nitromaritima sp. SCGC AAA799-C22]KMP11623.1 hypothetical protein UR09_02850 [Candidatus Nitromaritima sp. SCGC AAA799-A02]